MTPPEKPELPFEATLSPHRSLSRAAFLALMFAIAAVSFVSGVLFYIAGAWPVSFFFGLDAALIYVAFRLNFRDGRKREAIFISREEVRLTQHDVIGRVRYKSFDPFWVRLVRRETKRGDLSLALAVRRDATEFATFLNTEERADFADLVEAALIEARGGVRI